MIEARAEELIRAPIEAVFEVLADATNEPHWLPGAEAVEKLSDGPLRAGTRFRGKYARAGTIELQIVEFERPTRVTFRGKSKMVQFDDEVHLTAEGDHTRLQAELRAEPQGLMRLFGGLMGKTMRTQFEQNWVHLGAYVVSR